MQVAVLASPGSPLAHAAPPAVAGLAIPTLPDELLEVAAEPLPPWLLLFFFLLLPLLPLLLVGDPVAVAAAVAAGGDLVMAAVGADAAVPTDPWHISHALHWHRTQCAVLALVEHHAMHVSTLAVSPGRVEAQVVVVVLIAIPLGDGAAPEPAVAALDFFIEPTAVAASTTRKVVATGARMGNAGETKSGCPPHDLRNRGARDSGIHHTDPSKKGVFTSHVMFFCLVGRPPA